MPRFGGSAPQFQDGNFFHQGYNYVERGGCRSSQRGCGGLGLVDPLPNFRTEIFSIKVITMLREGGVAAVKGGVALDRP